MTPRPGAWALAWDDGAGSRGRVALVVPGGGARCRYEAMLSAPELGAGVYVVRDDDVPAPRGRALEIRAEGLWAELVCEVPGVHWGFGLEAFGLRFASWAEAEHAAVGERVPVGLDLEWEVTAEPAPERVPGSGAGAGDRGLDGAAPGVVVGVVLAGHARSAVDAPGTFTQRAGT